MAKRKKLRQKTREHGPKEPVGRSLYIRGVDLRSVPVRHYRDTYNAIVDDLGGADALSVMQHHLVRRAVTLLVALENADADMVQGEELDLQEYVRATESLRRLLTSLGLRKKMKDVTSLASIIEEEDEGRAGSSSRRGRGRKPRRGNDHNKADIPKKEVSSKRKSRTKDNSSTSTIIDLEPEED